MALLLHGGRFNPPWVEGDLVGHKDSPVGSNRHTHIPFQSACRKQQQYGIAICKTPYQAAGSTLQTTQCGNCPHCSTGCWWRLFISLFELALHDSPSDNQPQQSYILVIVCGQGLVQLCTNLTPFPIRQEVQMIDLFAHFSATVRHATQTHRLVAVLLSVVVLALAVHLLVIALLVVPLLIVALHRHGGDGSCHTLPEG